MRSGSIDGMAAPQVVELFAGVGGFRLGLERQGFQVVWSNQWEPATRIQHASACYVSHFGSDGHVCGDLQTILDEAQAGIRNLPEHDLLVGGYPCQDYSVARTLQQARGIEGKRGVLWWQIHRLLGSMRPRFLLLENVDRLLKSPARQRGRDFAVMLATLADLGYDVQWRLVNAADYGFPQRRRRVFILGQLAAGPASDPADVLTGGVLARALPVRRDALAAVAGQGFEIKGSAADVSEAFGSRSRSTPFGSVGFMSSRQVWTTDVVADRTVATALGDIIEPVDQVPERFFLRPSDIQRWRYLKGAKREQRFHRATGTPYFYAEGPVAFPDPTDRPARTILTGEGGPSPSRFKHVIATDDGRLRRLTLRELERLNGFPDDWTATGMPDNRRAFVMGNALVVGIVERIARQLLAELRPSAHPGGPAVAA